MANCLNCKYGDFSDKNVATGTGYCKRYPPTMHMFPAQDKFTGQMSMQQIVAQPVVRSDQSCGEFVQTILVQ